MCGIVGAVGTGIARAVIEAMADAVRHRGPDAQGLWMHGPVALAHRRLSIIDLSDGQQPMPTADGRCRIVFNGEIYNYREIRKELELLGRNFRTRSDTEVILQAYQQWGRDCLARLIGMFAFALWDEDRRQLWLVRDRIGKKPLYYRLGRGIIYFASEAKALWTIPGVTWDMDAAAVDQYLNFRYIPSQRTFFREVSQLEAGHWIVVDDQGIVKEQRQWWQLPDVRGPVQKSEQDCRDEFHALFADAVKYRLVADVPVGVFLSSGIDSYAVAQEMGLSAPPVCFTIGIKGALDESADARQLAQGLASRHHVFHLQESDFGIFSKIAADMDEPYGDPIILPTYILAREASSHVKAVMTGDGADEIMGTYVHHRTLNMLSSFPPVLRQAASVLAGILPWQMLDRFFDYPAAMGQEGKRRAMALLKQTLASAQAYRLTAELFDQRQRQDLYHPDFSSSLRGEKDNFAQRMEDYFSGSDRAAADKAIGWDLRTWFPQQTLMKTDRLTMMHGLEARCPFADHRLVEFFGRLPLPYFKSITRNKSGLRQYYGNRLSGLSRRKKPFYLPMDNQFRRMMVKLRQDATDPQQWKPFRIFKEEALLRLKKQHESSTLLGDKQMVSMAVLLYWFQARRAQGLI